MSGTTQKIVVSGMTYEVDGMKVFKIRKDGSRGQQLSTGCHRWYEVIQESKKEGAR